jgi:hypothetical protein
MRITKINYVLGMVFSVSWMLNVKRKAVRIHQRDQNWVTCLVTYSVSPNSDPIVLQTHSSALETSY